MEQAFHKLTWRQKQAIRKIKDNPDAEGIHNSTLKSLVHKQYIKYIDGEDYELTYVGELAFKRIMSSGDAPEALKEMFIIKPRTRR